ncbi:MAG TPA: hypothetical protein VGN88_07310 [Phycisphaerae bacterium]
MVRRSFSLVIVSGILAAAAANAAGAVPATPAPSKLPFAISKETTIITAPLRPDGRPDYVAALNEKYGKGVTPGNNALAQFLQIRGTALLDNDSRDKILQLAGIKPPAADTPLFEDVMQYANRGGTTLTGDALSARKNMLLEKWPPVDEDGELAKYLHSQDKFLDLAVEASRQPHLFVPYVSKDGSFFNVTIARYTGLAEFGRTLSARALLRVGNGNLEGALSDGLAMKRLARLLPQEGMIISDLLGLVLDDLANTTLGTIVAAGKLTEAQCDELAKGLDIPPVMSITESLDTFERWRFLDELGIIATGHTDDFAGQNLNDQTSAMILSIQPALVDWNLALTLFNAQRDREIVLLKNTPIDQMDRQAGSFAAEQDKWKQELINHHGTLEKDPGESQADYTQRVLHGIMSGGSMPMLAPRAARELEIALRDAMLNILVSAAKSKARTGDWPASLDALVPASIKEIPIDFYSTDRKSPVSYRNIAGHVRIYSVGPDHVRFTDDDLFVGDPNKPTPEPGLP